MRVLVSDPTRRMARSLDFRTIRRERETRSRHRRLTVSISEYIYWRKTAYRGAGR